MPNFKLSHEDNRKKICAPCGLKIKGKTIRKLNDSQINIISRLVNDDFDPSNSVYPLGICASCRVKYREVDKDESKVDKLPKMPNYKIMGIPRQSRQNSDCECFICKSARDCMRSVKEKGGRSNTKNYTIDIAEKFSASGSNSEVTTQTKDNTSNKRSSITICDKCKQEVGKGIDHDIECSVTSAPDNIAENVLQLPNTQQEQIISKLLAVKAKGSDLSKENKEL